MTNQQILRNWQLPEHSGTGRIINALEAARIEERMIFLSLPVIKQGAYNNAKWYRELIHQYTKVVGSLNIPNK